MLWLVLISWSKEGRKLSWPGWLGETPRWFARPKTVTHPSIDCGSQELNSRLSIRESNARATRLPSHMMQLWCQQKQLELKTFLLNINCTQVATSVHWHHPQRGRNGPICCCMTLLQRARYNAFSMGRKCVHGNLDLWPWHSISSTRGT